MGVGRVWLEVGSYNRGHGVGVREIKMAVRYPSSPHLLPCSVRQRSLPIEPPQRIPMAPQYPNIPFQPLASRRFPRKTQFVTTFDLVEFRESSQNWQKFEICSQSPVYWWMGGGGTLGKPLWPLLIIPTQRGHSLPRQYILEICSRSAHFFWEFHGWLKSKGSLQIMRIIWESCSDRIVFSCPSEKRGTAL